ncbi:MAG: GntR family transcriptional regulator [Gammaproteobacteria bacterium RIFOXYB2_FULL_38_6]|nr:MAG: GntR family transcriptional regulator [Gammaproteobacteria bacterium RIFOXYB2_FULL_38_6]
MEFTQQQAIYLQIADYVCEKILQKEWKENNKIPSIRELAMQLEVNPNTVAKTYAQLETQKIIETQRGVGYFVTSNAYHEILNLKKKHFLKTHLPFLFKQMDLLSLSLQDLKNLYHEFKQSS